MAEIVFPVAARAAGVPLTSGPLTVPVGATGVDFLGSVPEPYLSDPVSTIDMRIQVSIASGPWQDRGGATWVGGSLDKSGAPVQPHSRVMDTPGSEPLAGCRARFGAIPGVALDFGATLSTL